jgi:hypothetical protein
MTHAEKKSSRTFYIMFRAFDYFYYRLSSLTHCNTIELLCWLHYRTAITCAVFVPCWPIQLNMIIKEDGKAECNCVRFHVFLYNGTCRHTVPFFTLIKYLFVKWDAQTAGFEAQQTLLKRSLSLRHGIHHLCKGFSLIPTHGPPKDCVACWPIWRPRLPCSVFKDADRTRLKLKRNRSISFLRDVVSKAEVT